MILKNAPSFQLTFVTGNKGKFEEVEQFVSRVFMLLQEDCELEEIQSHSLEQVSQHKAREAFKKLGVPVLVDDTWIFFDQYHEFPGVMSKFIYHSLRKEGLLKLLPADGNKRWNFTTVLSYFDESLDDPVSFIGKTEGIFDFSRNIHPSMSSSLPFNSFFVPDGREISVAEDYSWWLQDGSQRGKATKKLLEFLTKRGS